MSSCFSQNLYLKIIILVRLQLKLNSVLSYTHTILYSLNNIVLLYNYCILKIASKLSKTAVSVQQYRIAERSEN